MNAPVEFRLRAPQQTNMLDRKDPMAAASAYVARYRTESGQQGLIAPDGQFYIWRKTHWELLSPAALVSDLWMWSCACVGPDEKPFRPTKDFIANVRAAVYARTYRPPYDGAVWLQPAEGDADPDDLIVCLNGNLNARTREFTPPTPRLFTVNVLPFDADLLAPPPVNWLGFLEQLMGGDRAALELLQEWIALSALTRDTSYQKSLLIIGPKRSGKGTILRTTRALAGRANVCSPTFASLGTPFGLQPLIDKRVALLSDARLSSRTDLAVLAEVILRVTGEDAVTVPRKFLTDWTGNLAVRFTVATNELPNLADASGALASRFLIVRLTRSFYGEEDQGLTDRLLGELPGILNWALDGLDRLRARGRFVQPASSRELVEELETLSSPITMFVRDCCVLDTSAESSIESLYRQWLDWCIKAGRDHPGTVAMFGRNLTTAFSELRKTQPRRNGKQVRCYAGIRLRNLMDTDDDPFL